MNKKITLSFSRSEITQKSDSPSEPKIIRLVIKIFVVSGLMVSHGARCYGVWRGEGIAREPRRSGE